MLKFDLYEGHMIKNNFSEVPPPPPVIAVQEKLLATQPYNLTHLFILSFMSDFLTPSNLKALNLGQPPLLSS